MQSTDRLQVRDLIEKLSPFDPMARVSGIDFEIIGVSKRDNCLVYLETDKNEELRALEDECSELEDDKTAAEERCEKLLQRLAAIETMANNEPEKLVAFILEGEE